MSGDNGHREIDWGRIGETLLHETKIVILGIIETAEGPVSPKEIDEITDIGLSNISYHAKTMLDEFEWLVIAKEIPRRGAMQHYYALADDILCATQSPAPEEEK